MTSWSFGFFRSFGPTATGLFAATCTILCLYSQFASDWAVFPFPFPILQESDWAFSNPTSGVIDFGRRRGLSGNRYRLARHGLAHPLSRQDGLLDYEFQ